MRLIQIRTIIPSHKLNCKINSGKEIIFSHELNGEINSDKDNNT